MNSQANLSQNRSIVAQVVLALVAVLGLATMALFLLNLNTPVPASWGTAGGMRNNFSALLNTLLLGVVLPLVTTALGTVIVSRQPHNRVGWLLIALGVCYLLIGMFAELTVAMNLTAQPALSSGPLVAWINNWIWVLTYSLLVLVLALFPTGHFLSRRWTVAIGLPLIGFTAGLLTAAAIEQTMSSAYQVQNPFVATHPEALYDALFAVGVPMMPIMLLMTLGEMTMRYRRSGPVERQQIKWLLAGLVATAIMVVIGLALVFAAGSAFGALLVNAAPVLPVLAIGVAMLRYRLYDIDLVIRRTLVYTMITAVLLVVYFASVTLLTSLFSSVTGQQSALAIVISTLAIAALFNPLRRRIQGTIDRRFFRKKYNAQQVLAQFALTARNETDLDVLTEELVHVVQETLQPEQVTVWLRK